MKVRLSLIAAVVLSTTVALAQDWTRRYTSPSLPPREALDRLNLQIAWRTYVPVEGRRDALVSVQLSGPDMFLQSRQGLITCLDLASGARRWVARLPLDSTARFALGFNLNSVFAIGATRLLAFDRATGDLQWQYDLPGGPTAPPVADEEQVYLGLGSKLYVYLLPRITSGNVAIAAEGKRDMLPAPSGGPVGTQQTPGAAEGSGSLYGGSVRALTSIGPLGKVSQSGSSSIGPTPYLLFEQRLDGPLDQAPIYTADYLLAPSANGMIYGLSKFARQELYALPTAGPISLPAGQYGEYGYVASQDYNVYAVNIVLGRIVWRYSPGTVVQRPPAVTNEDVYVTGSRSGLHRLRRETGDPVWENPTADRFLAANPKFVYAADRVGRLMILDRQRGTTLTTYEGAREFNVPISNEHSDRLFLAANDGLLVCLHDKAYRRPVSMRTDAGAGSLQAVLDKPVTIGQEIEGSPLQEALEFFTDRQDVKIILDQQAFKAAGMPNIGDAVVNVPKGEKQPFGKLLQAVLDQVNATFVTERTRIVVVPGKMK